MLLLECWYWSVFVGVLVLSNVVLFFLMLWYLNFVVKLLASEFCSFIRAN